MQEMKPAKKRLTYTVTLPGGQERLVEAILYVSDRCRAAERFGLIKLNKIIWRADFSAFAKRRVPVTGRAYQRLTMGPAPVEMRPLLDEMRQDGKIEVDKISLAKRVVEQRVVPIIPPRNRYFSPDDIDYLEMAIEHYWSMTGSESSDDSHGIAWATRDDGEAMPYELAFLSDQKLTNDQIGRLSMMAQERGWHSA